MYMVKPVKLDEFMQMTVFSTLFAMAGDTVNEDTTYWWQHNAFTNIISRHCSRLIYIGTDLSCKLIRVADISNHSSS